MIHNKQYNIEHLITKRNIKIVTINFIIFELILNNKNHSSFSNKSEIF